jgi:hypothetical protein
VPQVIQAWFGCCRRCLDAGGAQQLVEGLAGVDVVEPGPGAGEEERRGVGVRAELVAAPGVIAQVACGGRVQRDQPGLAELGVCNGQDAFGEVDLVAVQAHGLPGPQAGHGHQPDEGGEGRGPQRVGERSGRVHQRGDLLRGIEERRCRPAAAAGQKVLRRDLGASVQDRQVSGEDPHHRQPGRPPGWVGLGGQGGPGQRGLDGQTDRAALLQERDELAEQPPVGIHLVTQVAPHLQILLGGLTQGAHHAPAPGQGRTTAASAA